MLVTLLQERLLSGLCGVAVAGAAYASTQVRGTRGISAHLTRSRAVWSLAT